MFAVAGSSWPGFSPSAETGCGAISASRTSSTWARRVRRRRRRGPLRLKNEELFALATDVAAELRKVTWPTRKETVSSTIIVIITTIVSALLLGMFDGMWSWVTRLIYG